MSISTFLDKNRSPELDYKIVSYIPEDDLLTYMSLTLVNQRGNELFSNHEFFQKLFNKYSGLDFYLDVSNSSQYYYDKNFKNFELLKRAYPTSFWKMACIILLGHKVHIHKSRPQEAFPILAPEYISKLNQSKESVENRLKVLCGTYFGDPNGALDKAWKSHLIFLEIPLIYISARADYHQISMLDAIKQLQLDSKNYYSTLEQERINCENNIIVINKKIDLLKEGELSNEFKTFYEDIFISNMRFILGLRYPLKEKRLIAELQTIACFINEQIPHNDIEVQIRININGLDNKDISKYIWEKFYFLCGNGIIEDKWSENHFQENLSDLYAVIEEFISDYENLQKGILAQNPLRQISFSQTDKTILIPALTKICELIDSAITQEEKLVKISMQIDTLPLSLKQFIWRQLYVECGNNVIEHDWAKKHFHEHLTNLLAIINKTCAKITLLQSLHVKCEYLNFHSDLFSFHKI